MALVYLTRRMLNVWRSVSVTKMSTVTSCIVESATTLQWIVDPSYYLLEQIGGLLLDTANPRERFFIWPFFKIKSAYLFHAFLRQKSLT